MNTERADGAHRTPFVRRWQDRVTALEYDGRPVVVARELGAMLDYGDEGKGLADLVSTKWSDEFLDDVDVLVLRGERLAAFKRVCAELGLELVDKRAPSLLLLTESGVQLVLARTEKPEGKLFRRWLVGEVIPAYHARQGLPGPSPATPSAAVVDAAARPGALTCRGPLRPSAPVGAPAVAGELLHDLALLGRLVARLAREGAIAPAAAAALDVMVEGLPDRVEVLEVLARAREPRPDARPSLALAQPPAPPRRRTWPETVAARARGELDDATFQRLRLTRQAARVSLADHAVAPDALGELVDRIEAALDAAGVRTPERGGY